MPSPTPPREPMALDARALVSEIRQRRCTRIGATGCRSLSLGMWCDACLLTAVLGLIEQQQWQPIDTAPKDGTDVLLLLTGGSKRVGNWARLRACWSVDALPPVPTPTHWMPLPPPPSMAGARPVATEGDTE
jgi:hypothetical protein